MRELLQLATVGGSSFLGVVSAFGVLWRASAGPRRAWRDFQETWCGEPARPGLTPRPGLPERVLTLERKVARAHPETF